MKKLFAVLMALVVAFTLSSCSNDEPDSYKLENFLVYSVKISVNDKIQYDSLYNADSTNEILFTSTKDILAGYTLTKVEDSVEVCASTETSNVTFEIELTTGDVVIQEECYKLDGVNTVVTVLTFDDDSVVYTEDDLFNAINELLE